MKETLKRKAISKIPLSSLKSSNRLDYPLITEFKNVSIPPTWKNRYITVQLLKRMLIGLDILQDLTFLSPLKEISLSRSIRL